MERTIQSIPRLAPRWSRHGPSRDVGATPSPPRMKRGPPRISPLSASRVPRASPCRAWDIESRRTQHFRIVLRSDVRAIEMRCDVARPNPERRDTMSGRRAVFPPRTHPVKRGRASGGGLGRAPIGSEQTQMLWEVPAPGGCLRRSRLSCDTERRGATYTEALRLSARQPGDAYVRNERLAWATENQKELGAREMSMADRCD